MKTIFPLLILIIMTAAPSYAADWSPWTQLDDGALNGIEFSHRNDCTAGKPDSCTLRWRFRSNYDDPVDLEYTLAWDTKQGLQRKQEKVALKPGENSLAEFIVSGRTLDEVSVRIIADAQSVAAARQQFAAVEEQKRIQEEDQQRFANATRTAQQRQQKEAEAARQAEEQRQEAARQTAEESDRQEEEARAEQAQRSANYRAKEQAIVNREKAKKARKDEERAAKKAADARQAELDQQELARAEEHRQRELAKKLRRIDEESERNKRRIDNELSLLQKYMQGFEY